MRETINYVVREFLGGVVIGIAGFCYLMIDNPVVGAIFFSTGLLIIITNRLSLYTGEIGFMPFLHNVSYYKKVYSMLRTLIFNALGAASVGFLIRNSYLYGYVSDRVSNLMNEKIAYPGTGFFLALFCGALIFIGIHYRIYKFDNKTNLEEYFILMLCVSVFVICKFDHCIANAFYISLSGIPIVENTNLIGFWCMTVLGNTVGSLFMAYALHIDD